METQNHPVVNELEELGFITASKKVDQEIKNEAELKELKNKVMLAYERYRFITPKNIERFNGILKKKSIKQLGAQGHYSYETLLFTPISQYDKIPPADVLEKLRSAKKEGLFDEFEVCTIKTVEVRPDPIIFGTIRNCEDKFFIAQWDEDVKIEDIISSVEG